tara:strand:+ start:1409 stop:1675 length:267 start_codon:yes stop_codon:yes gene_type:complete
MSLRNWISNSKKTQINEEAIIVYSREGSRVTTTVSDLDKIMIKADSRNEIGFVEIAMLSTQQDIKVNLSEDQVRFLRDKFDEALKYHF